ncbi:LPS export ABC transporter permease LptF [Pseudoruegeria sp. SHC-113]|uniref:LPS export ABC transporter permease LptF n=1 Tax=Pseudoruegeria sp. SHC-113 TaxID=2855439 RepID=UPI0021BA6DFF|nr:LPS export ABC transporter permease LptF [Pseudoruegeria sp. SHC-113]MCT8160605.1 LPS export ABC transporter permease LptF [Pseudoruegeria sp. SHC-113]
MAKFDRYFLSQLLALFGFFSLILVLVYWVNRAVSLFDTLISNGQSAVVFLEFTALTLPNVIRVVMPIAAFVATIYVTNRLSTESELVVVQSTGFSPYRLARPVFAFGVIVFVLMSILTHLLVPSSNRQLTLRTAEIAENVAAGLLVEGTFMHPAKGITFYIREISASGELQDIFLTDARNTELQTTYTAKLALLVREDTGPKLLMFDGMAQTLNAKANTLSTTQFEDFVFDIGALVPSGDPTKRKPRELSTPELLSLAPELLEETGRSAAVFLQEAHERITQGLVALVAVMTGFAALLVGGYSRFGIWKQIVGAVVLLVVMETLDNAMSDIAQRDPEAWPVMYVAPALGLLATFVLLWISTKPGLFKRRRAQA